MDQIYSSKTSIKIVCLIIISFTLVGLFGLLFAKQLHIERYSKLMAIIASTGFVLLAVIGLYVNKSIYNILILLGLSFCWLGDLLGSEFFVLSVTAFLVAHLWFITAFSFRGLQAKKSILVSAVFIPISGVIYFWLYPYLPHYHKFLVLGYVIVITAMVISSFGTRHRDGRVFIIVGAVLFYISDIFVARWKYVNASHINAFFCYPLYYASCISLALSSLAYRNRVYKK